MTDAETVATTRLPFSECGVKARQSYLLAPVTTAMIRFGSAGTWGLAERVVTISTASLATRGGTRGYRYRFSVTI